MGPCQDEQGPLQRQRNPPLRDRGAPTQGTVGAVPRTGRAPTQELAFRYRTRYIFDIDRHLAQLEVDDGRAGLRLLHVGDRSWWYFRFLSIESMIERNYLILPVSSSCLLFLRVFLSLRRNSFGEAPLPADISK